MPGPKEHPITAIASDYKSHHLLIAQGSGEVTFLKSNIEDQWDMIDVGQNQQSYNANPATTADILNGGLDMFIVGFASGTVQLFLAETGRLICELAAHSRQINALVAHPSK